LERANEHKLERREVGDDDEVDGGRQPPAASERGADKVPPQVRGGEIGVRENGTTSRVGRSEACELSDRTRLRPCQHLAWRTPECQRTAAR
jgi:hypothetical protein